MLGARGSRRPSACVRHAAAMRHEVALGTHTRLCVCRSLCVCLSPRGSPARVHRQPGPTSSDSICVTHMYDTESTAVRHWWHTCRRVSGSRLSCGAEGTLPAASPGRAGRRRRRRRQQARSTPAPRASPALAHVSRAHRRQRCDSTWAHPRQRCHSTWAHPRQRCDSITTSKADLPARRELPRHHLPREPPHIRGTYVTAGSGGDTFRGTHMPHLVRGKTI